MIKSIISALGFFHRGFLIMAGFALCMLFCACVLMLPVSQNGGAHLSFLDVLFTAVSVISVTGLAYIDIEKEFSLFGQIFIMIMSEIGGLGIVTAMAVWGISTGKRIQLRERLLIKDSFNLQTPSGVVWLVKRIVTTTLWIECISSILLSIYFVPQYGWRGVYLGCWYSVASFCNTGFDILGAEGGVAGLMSHPYPLIIIYLTSLLGGVGFLVINDVIDKRSWRKFQLNTKIVITTGLFLTAVSTVAFLCLEGENPASMAALSWPDKVVNALFMASSSRMSGFSMVDMTALKPATLLLTIALMSVGTGPVSTGGGIRTTTLAVLYLSTASWLRGRHQVVVYHKRIPMQVLYKALNIFFIYSGFVFLTTFAMLVCNTGGFSFGQILFESVSAFSTVGLTAGVTAQLNTSCKIILMIAMFIGRVGIMTLSIVFGDRRKRNLQFPEENISIG